MIAIGNYIIIKDIAENIKKTAGGLELADKHEEMRYRKGIVISSGPDAIKEKQKICLLYTSPSPRDLVISRMPSSA